MSIADCINKLVTAGSITRDVADKALGLHERMKAEFSAEAPPAPAEASAALATAKALRDSAAERERYIANKVENFRLGEQRIVEHPYGRQAGLMSILTKDAFRGGNAMRDMPVDSPVKRGMNVDYLRQRVKGILFGMFGTGMEHYRPGILANNDIIRGVKNFIYERFGVDTGDQTAKAASAGFKDATEFAVDRVRQAGKIFEPNEDWRVPQHWRSERVAQFSEAEFVRDYKAEIENGGLKLWDKDVNRPATADRTDDILKRAYSDIKTESSAQAPFSKEMRTFRFQEGKSGADSFLKLQAKYGAGDEIMSTIVGHLDHMSREIALQELGVDQGNFAGWMRLVKDKPEMPVVAGAEKYNPVRLLAPLIQSEAMLKNTFKVVTGRGNPVENQKWASIMGGMRDLVGASGLRNLPITIMPSDTVTMLMGANYNGMPAFKLFGEVFNGLTKEEAAHLQINAHSVSDYVNNSVRKYEDQINYSGLARKVTRTVVRATGADLWTTSIRNAAMTSFSNLFAEMRGKAFGELPAALRDFLDRYGFSADEWDKIRAAEPIQMGNGAKYYLNPEGIDGPLYERLLADMHEQSSYMAHQPDARTLAFATRGTARGSVQGELMRSLFQFKQFALERMTTHMMRVLIDGPIENRITRGLAFTALSMGAGALSLQAAAIIAGKDPLDMSSPKFWGEAFVKGGAGGIYGDVLAAALRGDRGGPDMLAQLAGPLPGLVGDVAGAAAAPIKAQFDDSGRQQKSTRGQKAIATGRRFTPNTWYTKLAVDRLLWDKLQVMIDPNYRQSFRRAEQRASKQGQGFWWGPGENTPDRAPNLSTAVGH